MEWICFSLLLLLIAIKICGRYIWNKHKNTASEGKPGWSGPWKLRSKMSVSFLGWILGEARNLEMPVGGVCKNPEKSQKMRKGMAWPSQTEIFYTKKVLLLTNTTRNLWPHLAYEQKLREQLDFYHYEALSKMPQLHPSSGCIWQGQGELMLSFHWVVMPSPLTHTLPSWW